MSLARTLALGATLLAALLVACTGGDGNAAEVSSPPLSDETIRNLTFPSEVTASGEAPLSDGSYQEDVGRAGSASLASVTLTNIARGDLDGDGDEDVAAILVESGGGSGSFYGLWAILNDAGDASIAGESVMLGDRIRVHDFAVEEDGTIRLDATVHGPDDPMCCPTLDVTQRYRFDGALVPLED